MRAASAARLKRAVQPLAGRLVEGLEARVLFATTADLDAGPAPAAGATSYDFKVTYTGDVPLAAATVGGDDVVVTGPNGFTQAATVVSSPISGQLSVLSSLNLSNVGQLNAIGFDPVSGNIYVHASSAATIPVFTPAGVPVAITVPAPGASTNDSDIDFADVATTVAGQPVPANTLLWFNGDDAPDKVHAANKVGGPVIAAQDLPASTNRLVGGAQHAARGSFYAVNFDLDQLVEFNPATGAELAVFPVAPAGSPAFDVFFGDVDVLAATGNLYVVSSAQAVIRELTPTGAFVRDFDVSSLGISGISGIAFDDASGEAWVSTTGGQVFRLGGFGTGDGGGGGNTRTVTYRVTAPGGTVDAADVGAYTVAVQANAVADVGGAFVPAGAIGTFVFAPNGVQSFDLTDDWSDAANPNGAWAYREGNNALPHVDWWQRNQGGFTTSPQGGWAESEDGNNRLPFWFKSQGGEVFTRDWQAGDVVVHTTDPDNGAGNGPANVTWTSPAAGVVQVSGAVWMGREIGRSNQWTLSKNGTTITEGAISAGDPFSRSSPFDFAAGSGGAAAVQNIPVQAGDVIALTLTATTPAGGSGDFVGTEFSVDLAPTAPPPAGAVQDVNTVNIPGPTPDARDLAVQDDGKIVAVGIADNGTNDDAAVFRLNADGSLDTTFGGGDGVVFLDLVGQGEQATAVALQPGGKIVVAGTVNVLDGGNGQTVDSNYFVARLNADGTLDTTFGGNDGFAVADFADDAEIQPTFDEGTALTVQADGSVLIAGVSDKLDPAGDFAMVRYQPDGTEDNTFGGDGTNKLIVPRGQGEAANAVAIQPNGKIVIGGEFVAPGGLSGTFGLLRLNSNGSVDTAFGTNGFVTTEVRDGADGVTSLAVQPDGKIVAGGFASSGDPATDAFDLDFALARYTADGALDPTFDADGLVLTSIPGQLAELSKVAIDPAGNVISVGRSAASRAAANNGEFSAAVTRHRPDGALDTRFSDDGILVIPFTQLTGASVQLAPLAASLVVAAAQQAAGAELIQQIALVALSVQGKLSILLTAGAEVRLATVSNDSGGPAATIALLPTVTSLGQADATFVVEYADDLAIDVGTLGTGDILVTGPGGVVNQPAEFVAVDNNTNGTPRRATYRFIPPGGSFNGSNNGTYTLAVGVDQVRDVSGQSLTAGAITGATFDVNITVDGANLTVGAVTGAFPPAVVGGGKAKGGSVLVTNNGNRDAVGTVNILVVASANNAVDGADAQMGTFPARLKLRPGQAKAFKLKFKTFPSSLPDGNYFILAQVDSANALTETSELDNVGSTASAVNIAAPFVDLGFTGPVTGFKSPLAPGKRGRLSVPLRNNGNISAKATVSGRLFASLDGTQSADDRLVGTLPIRANLKPGTTKATKVSFTAPLDLPAGSYTLILVLDAPGNDRDAGDNTAASTGTITIG